MKKISGAEEGEEVDDDGDIGAFHDSVADIVCFGWSCRACQKYVCINCKKQQSHIESVNRSIYRPPMWYSVSCV